MTELLGVKWLSDVYMKSYYKAQYEPTNEVALFLKEFLFALIFNNTFCPIYFIEIFILRKYF